jgi:hypothetical protein
MEREFMFFEEMTDLRDEEFQRLTGIKRPTFERCLEILEIAERLQKARGGRPNHLSLENRMLMTLCYWREYRTYFHIALDFNVSESACFRNIVWVENCLVSSKVFALPGRGCLQNAKNGEILIDVTESPIERPKKSRNAIIQERKNVIP